MTLSSAHINVLACPVCGLGLLADHRALACPAGHRFDIARHGHVTLSASPIRHPGDTADMLAARAVVQDAGLQAPLTAGLIAAVPASSRLVVDLGAGTGHHLAALLEDRPGAYGLAIDSSRYAGRRAARAHASIGSVVADVRRQLPITDGSVDVVLSVFAPRPGKEISRIMRGGGSLVVLTPRADHLAELVGPLGLLSIAEDKVERLTAGLPATLQLTEEHIVERAATVDSVRATALISMGPNAFHRTPDEIAAAVAGLILPTEVTVSVDIRRFTRA